MASNIPLEEDAKIKLHHQLLSFILNSNSPYENQTLQEIKKLLFNIDDSS